MRCFDALRLIGAVSFGAALAGLATVVSGIVGPYFNLCIIIGMVAVAGIGAAAISRSEIERERALREMRRRERIASLIRHGRR